MNSENMKQREIKQMFMEKYLLFYVKVTIEEPDKEIIQFLI